MPALPPTANRREPTDRKKTTNPSLSADVLDAARNLNINLSQVCDDYLRELVRREQQRRWREDHAEFITAYNATIETDNRPWTSGKPSDGPI